VFDHYGDVVHKSYDAETATIYNFLQEVNENNANDIAVLDLSEWIRRLDVVNKAFDTLQKQRYDENAKKAKLRMADIRKETNRNYRSMLNHIDASILLNGEAQHAPFVNALSVRVEHYTNIIAQRKGRAKKKTK
jgi:hypothetical protein